MSREIKFRAWDAIEGKMWLPIVRPDARLMAPNQMGGYMTFDDPQDPLMQFTGLHDKNGKEIWEGDILHFSYGIPGRRVHAPVVFKEGSFFAITEGHTPSHCRVADLEIYIGEFDVIGNVHENPDLLK